MHRRPARPRSVALLGGVLLLVLLTVGGPLAYGNRATNPSAAQGQVTSPSSAAPTTPQLPPSPGGGWESTAPAPSAGDGMPGTEAGSSATATPFGGSTGGSVSAAAGYPFGEDSVWRSRVDGAPVATNSSAMVAHLNGTVQDRYSGVAAFNAYQYSNSYYVAPAGTARIDVGFDDCQGKGYTPPGLLGPDGQFSGVPIPDSAVPSPGDDRALSIYSPETDQLWEFWGAVRQGDGWAACWGGRIDDVSSSPGWFSDGFGATATGLSSTGGMVSLADVRSGSIEHAMSLAIPNPAVWSVFSWPAQRSDGFDTHPDAVPEGTRLRLDPSIDVASLGLHPVAEMVARAAQQYGFIVVDKSGSVSVIAESGAAEEAETGTDPWASLLGGSSDYELLTGFPWQDLQAMPADYGS